LDPSKHKTEERICGSECKQKPTQGDAPNLLLHAVKKVQALSIIVTNITSPSTNITRFAVENREKKTVKKQKGRR